MVPNPLRAAVRAGYFPPLLILSLSVTAVSYGIVAWIDTRLVSSVGKSYGDLEFAGTDQRFERIVRAWEGHQVVFAACSAGVHGLVILGYLLSLQLLLSWAAEQGPLGVIGDILAWVQAGGALMDVLQHASIVYQLAYGVERGLAAVCRQIMWTHLGLKALAACYFVPIAIAALARKVSAGPADRRTPGRRPLLKSPSRGRRRSAAAEEEKAKNSDEEEERSVSPAGGPPPPPPPPRKGAPPPPPPPGARKPKPAAAAPKPAEAPKPKAASGPAKPSIGGLAEQAVARRAALKPAGAVKQ